MLYINNHTYTDADTEPDNTRVEMGESMEGGMTLELKAYQDEDIATDFTSQQPFRIIRHFRNGIHPITQRTEIYIFPDKLGTEGFASTL